MSALCEATSADVSQVAHALGTDSLVDEEFLNPSVEVGDASQKDILGVRLFICESPRADLSAGVTGTDRRHERLPEVAVR